ncbi:hypothetical protein BS618_32255 [Rhodococcus erythropolis]|uniref:hypothetical protein n=1 Tax=Rhodococcus TaxID=1827 RepID=UPI000935BE4F|nr:MULTISPECIES: hypothetical protein [Rhodococcus]MBP2522451.1 hypothetical protein [Rhodococcus sp. PvP104]MCZ4548080.1 hypothetical protein [Rhodococcus qingshengii]MDA3632016.1 hypothetical protein [Rhodococcus sp. C-2]OKA08527.1 hypothetical protein BS618_32255 [Rhodococcus erythropolis]
MQTPKFSRTYTTLRWTCILLFAVIVVLALIVLVPLFVERVDQWSGWQSGEWAAAGAWLGGTMTFFAVSVAVWQTNNANRQARAAETRAGIELAAAATRYDETMAYQKAAALRDREWAAVQMVSRAVSTVLAEVNGIHEIDTLHNDLRTTLTTEYILDRRKLAVNRISESAHDVQLAFSQLVDIKLLLNTQFIREHIKNITDMISEVEKTPHMIIWQEAQRFCGPPKEQNKQLQNAIVERFSEILEFPTGRRSSESPAEATN